MKEYIHIEELPIPIHVQSYKNSKSIKIIYKDGYLKVTKPKWYLTVKIKKYLKENAKDIYNNYLQNETKTGQISNILYKGKMFDIVINKIKENKIFINLKDNYFEVDIYEKIEAEKIDYFIKQALNNILKQLSKTYIIKNVEEISKIIGIEYNKIAIKDCRTIWGSCSSKGNLNFNFRLICMPNWVMESIIVHELCHRKYLNHNKDFWSLVYTYYPKEKYIQAKKWIKENMKELNKI
ncbi:MAG: M48 family metallopeptidase [Clostridiales bacterium]|nr:M48 family metallopeptidase [Clostridiales bacterium]